MNNLENELFSGNSAIVKKVTLKQIIKYGKLEDIPILEKFTMQKLDSELYFLARKGIEIIKEKNNIHPAELDFTHYSLEPQNVKITLFNDDPWKRIRIIQAITVNNKSDYLRDLKELLKYEKNDYVIATLVKAIGLLGHEHELDTIKPFLEWYDSRVRANAVETLGNMNTIKSFPLIIPKLSDPSPRVKINAANLLFTNHKDKTRLAVVEMLRHGAIYQVESALYFLERHPFFDDEIREILIALHKRAKTESLRKKISEIIKHISVKKLSSISDIVKNESPDVSTILDKKLRHKHNIEKIEKLREKIDDKPETELERFSRHLKSLNFEKRRNAIVTMYKYPRTEYLKIFEKYSNDKHPVIRFFAKKGIDKLK